MERAARMREAGTGYHQTGDKVRELVHRTKDVTINRFTPSSAKQAGLKDIELLLGMRLFLVLRCLLCFLF